MGLISYLYGMLGDRGTRTYEEGVAAGRIEGWEMVLDALAGKTGKTGDYKGKRPPDLDDWIAEIRARVERIKETGR